jgi:PAS domain-containing protein
MSPVDWVELNPAGEQLLGWTVDELRGRDMHEAVHHMREDGTHFPREACPLLAVLWSGDEFAETHDSFVRKDGTMLPAAYVSSPVIVDDAIVPFSPSGGADAASRGPGGSAPHNRLNTRRLLSALLCRASSSGARNSFVSLDAAAIAARRRRCPDATVGRSPRNKGLRCPADRYRFVRSGRAGQRRAARWSSGC